MAFSIFLNTKILEYWSDWGVGGEDSFRNVGILIDLLPL